MYAQVRIWFLRDVLEALQRATRGAGVPRLREALPRRLLDYLEPLSLAAAGAEDAMPADDAEELLLAIDTIVGDGSGSILAKVGEELAMRLLAHGGGFAAGSDLVGVLRRLRMPLFEHPFLRTEVRFVLHDHPEGFDLEIGVPRRPRATRALRHLASGVIGASATMSREAGSTSLTLAVESIADRTTIRARYPKRPPSLFDDERPTLRRRVSRPIRTVRELSAEVERILAGAPRSRGSGERARAGSRGGGSEEAATAPATGTDAPAPDSSAPPGRRRS